MYVDNEIWILMYVDNEIWILTYVDNEIWKGQMIIVRILRRINYNTIISKGGRKRLLRLIGIKICKTRIVISISTTSAFYAKL